MKKIWSAAVFVAAFSGLLSAQNHATCGMSREMLDQTAARLLASRAEAEAHGHDHVGDRGGVVEYVPVRFILVGEDDGSGRAQEGRVLDALCCMNEEYEDVGFRFYLKDNDFKYLNNSDVNVLQTGLSLTVMEQNDNESCVNYFILKTPDYGSNTTGGTILGYYTPQRDWLVIKKDQLSCLSSTLEHETGHFFSLLHPFNGWDQDPWPDGSAACAPTTSPGGVPTEKVSGSNALNAGDYLKDTPASYNFLLDDSNCSGGYTGLAKDPSPTCTPLAGVTQSDNYMDYFEACAQYKFTADQTDQMHNDLNSSGRSFLNNTFAPVAESITTPADMLLEPAVGETTTFFDKITFKWNSVPGATHYLLEVGVNPQMSAIIFGKLVKDTTWTGKVTGLVGGNVRHWRIRPINQYYVCADPTAGRKFTAGIAAGTSEIEGLTGWAVSPNPVSSTGQVALKTVSEIAFEADVEITSVNGQRVFFQPSQQFWPGENSYVLPTGEALAAGSYLVSLAQKGARQTQKLIVID